MKGDFSRVQPARRDNFNGILPQQGKVLLDSDGIAQTLITNDWHETAARDWVGRVAGVPAATPDSFRVSAASFANGVASVTVGTGHAWADGLLVRLDEPGGARVRTATWLAPPLVASAGGAPDDGTTDAVVLEVWQHAVNGYQLPDRLIEPALGGPDTAERLQTAFAFRLARLGAGQVCADLAYDESGRGALTASLVPEIVMGGDCPVEGSGGYSGFEHQLYRIEIADTDGGASQFKWSRCNGGLVGRGRFDPGTTSVAVTANLAAITSVGQSDFYLEIEAWDDALGHFRVIAGAAATLADGTLQCAAAPAFGAWPAAAGSVFVRLWDGIAPVASYPLSAAPAQLESGILLQFDAGGPGRYFPGDYWMFPVRAGGIANPQTLIDAKKPQGIVYRRVPLAEITWGSIDGITWTAEAIEDCRTLVPPLSQVKGCCTCRVGDGVSSFGDFTSIKAAIDSLPDHGGEVCILPGLYHERVLIRGCRDLVIHGCGWQTRVASPPAAVPSATKGKATDTGPVNALAAVFTIVDSQHVQLRSFAVEAGDGDVAILVDGIGSSQQAPPPQLARAEILSRGTTDVAIDDMVLTASTLPAILAMQVTLLRIAGNRVAMTNVRSPWPAVFASGREIRIERNWVGLRTPANTRVRLPFTVAGDLAASEPAAATSLATAPPTPAVLHPGGIQIGGDSTDVAILDNEIEGGSRNGITLGSFVLLDANGGDSGVWTGVGVVGDGEDCCTGTLRPPIGKPPRPGTLAAGGPLLDIQIHRNRIRDMGLCGIGPVALFDLARELEIISIVGLDISANEIARTLLRDLDNVMEGARTSIGYGAICVPDVRDLVVHDNAVTDFGAAPGLDVCGIFVLHGELIDISRNHIIETRDWTQPQAKRATSTGGARGGIVVLMGTAPTWREAPPASAWGGASLTNAAGASILSTPAYQPGLPAMRIEHNVVRVPLGQALAILGIGPLSIIGNHFGCGGLVRDTDVPLAQVVLVIDLGTSIDRIDAASLPSQVLGNANRGYTGVGGIGLGPVSCGSVLFADNVVQLEARASLQPEIAAIAVVTPDHLVFSTNQCWLDALRPSAIANALLAGGTLNVIGNRFQEAPNAVLLSGLTVGTANVTNQNISTHCLIALSALPTTNDNNIELVPNVDGLSCAELAKELAGALGR